MAQFKFDLMIDGLTREQADDLLDLIVSFVDEHDGICGGGFVDVSEDIEDGKETKDSPGKV